jgi:hypothetical protein
MSIHSQPVQDEAAIAVQGGIDIEMISKSLRWLKLYGERNKKSTGSL